MSWSKARRMKMIFLLLRQSEWNQRISNLTLVLTGNSRRETMLIVTEYDLHNSNEGNLLSNREILSDSSDN